MHAAQFCARMFWASARALPRFVKYASAPCAGSMGFMCLPCRWETGSSKTLCESKAPTKDAVDPLSPFVICGPSGVGKGYLIHRLNQEFPNRFGFSVSSTTRKPRPGEIDGTHYHFTTTDKMKKDIEEGRFVEHAQVHTNMYGTSVAALEDVRAKGQVAILDIDIQGAQQLKRKLKDAVYIFLLPPSMEVLEQRLRGRGTETEEKIRIRMANAEAEIDFSKEPGFFDLVITADDGLKSAWPQLTALIKRRYPHLH